MRAGQKAIRIFGYSSKKITDTDPDTGEETERRAPRFPILSVFDESQTDPNTELTPRMLKANPKAVLWADIEQHPSQRLTGTDPGGIYGQVRDVMTARGWTITHRELDGHTNGYTTCDGSRQIVIETALEPAQTAKTMIHEAAHALLHADLTGTDRHQLHRGIREVEAESVAYVLAGLLGLDTSTYSIGYIAEWAEADTELVTATGKRVLNTVHTLAEELNPQPTDKTTATNGAATPRCLTLRWPVTALTLRTNHRRQPHARRVDRRAVNVPNLDYINRAATPHCTNKDHCPDGSGPDSFSRASISAFTSAMFAKN